MKIGVILPSAQAVGMTSAPGYADIRRWAVQAEESGFDSVWIFDHLLVRRAEFHQLGVWEAWTLMSALAEATTRVEIGSWVMSVGFRNPALLAKMAVTLDEVSGGRLILGVGAGNQRGEFDAFGFDYDHRIGRFAEAIGLIAALLREGRGSLEGDFFRILDCEIDPRGPRPLGPPLLIGASGPRMLRLTARFADAWNAHYLGGAGHIAPQRAALDAACAEVGRDPAEIATTVGEIVAFGALSRPPAALTSFLDTTPEELGDLLHDYRLAGVDHLMLQCFPPDYDGALENLGVALARYRAGVPTT